MTFDDMDPALRYEQRIRVTESDIDELGHVNNVVYLRWVQNIAVAHWKAAADPADQAALFWVVVRHEIDYKRPSFPGDELIIRTWIGQAVKRNFERLTEIVRASDRKTVVSARTVWCPMSAVTGKPTDVSPEVHARFSTNTRAANV